jgi:hypothetical protein
MSDKWTTEEWTYMLALIDQLRDTRKLQNISEIQQTVKDRLKRKWRTRNFDINRVNTKMHWIWRNTGKQDSRQYNLPLEGSSCVDPNSFSIVELTHFIAARQKLRLTEEKRFTKELEKKIAQQRQLSVQSNQVDVKGESSHTGSSRLQGQICSTSDDVELDQGEELAKNVEKGIAAPQQGTEVESDTQNEYHLQPNEILIEPQAHDVLKCCIASTNPYVDEDSRIKDCLHHLPYISRKLDQQSSELKSYISCYNSARRSSISDKCFEITKLEEQIESLRGQRDVCRRLSNTELPPSMTRRKITEEISHIIAQIARICDDSLHLLTFNGDIALQGSLSSSQLELLWQTNDMRTMFHLKSVNASITFGKLLHQQLASVVCGVFESVFPNFESDRSKVLEMYRRKLASQQG